MHGSMILKTLVTVFQRQSSHLWPNFSWNYNYLLICFSSYSQCMICSILLNPASTFFFIQSAQEFIESSTEVLSIHVWRRLKKASLLWQNSTLLLNLKQPLFNLFKEYPGMKQVYFVGTISTSHNTCFVSASLCIRLRSYKHLKQAWSIDHHDN